MSKSHGTAEYTPDQLAAITAGVITALPKALQGISYGQALAVVNEGEELKRALNRIFSQGLIPLPALSLTDEEVCDQWSHLAVVVPNCRQMVVDLWDRGYDGPIFYLVPRWFTLKRHAPVLGPCYQDFGYVQGWDIPDPPTQEVLAFWPPRLVPESINKKPQEMLDLLFGLRRKYHLPESWLTGFGGAGLLANLILSHYRESGEQVPVGSKWACSDTADITTVAAVADNLTRQRLRFNFSRDGLVCGWYWYERQNYNLGCFALGVEVLEE